MPNETTDPSPWSSSEAARADAGAYLPLRGEPAPVALPRAHRPRERIFARGPSCLGHAELIALVLGAGTPRAPASAVAQRLIRRHGLQGLAALTPEAWRREPGIGAAQAARFAAAFELGRRARASPESDERPRITRPKDAWRLVSDLGRAKKEHLVGLYLDAQNALVHRETISIGSLNTTRTHPREILYPAIVHLALGFLLAHNHPSGCLDPSDEDVAFSRAVQRAGEIVGIELYDHLIVTAGGFTSLRERGAF